MERQGFEAHMRINNNQENATLSNVKINVNFTDDEFHTVKATSDTTDESALFYIKVDRFENISDMTGSGIVTAKSAADIYWLIIPAPGAGGKMAAGKTYYVGATISYDAKDKTESITVSPDYIQVRPMPELALDYFIPQYVFADDPYTDEIESEVPFDLGVRIKNTGFGDARNLKIESAQPEVKKNKLGLLIHFNILSSYINDAPAANSLLVDFGNLSSQNTAMARWQMTASLLGEFSEFKATYTHADELGGQLTSLIKETPKTHLLIHNVLLDMKGRDQILDFLAIDKAVYRLFESNGNDIEVTDLSTATTMNTHTQTDIIQFTSENTTGPIYIKKDDPFNGEKALISVIRTDGKILDPNNYWLTTIRKDKSESHPYIHLFDYDTSGSYELKFGQKPVTEMAPNLQAIPDRIIRENDTLSFIIEASHPSGNIPTITSSGLPAGASFVDEGMGKGHLSWTPISGQAGRYKVSFQAKSLGLTTSRDAAITVKGLDDPDIDGDGLPDVWETRYFGDLRRDGSGDYDGDGSTDREEYLNNTDPTIANLPAMPTLDSPLMQSRLSTQQPELTIINTAHPAQTKVSYQFEIYSDPTLSERIAQNLNVQETVGKTTWKMTAALEENQTYYWRVRAFDGANYSYWNYGEFTIDLENEAPLPFTIKAPANGIDVHSEQITLAINNSTDPEKDDIYTIFKLARDQEMNQIMAQSGKITPNASGSTDWQYQTTLDEGAYYWQVSAIDTRGAETKTAINHFNVNFNAETLTQPTIRSPQAEVTVSNTEMTLIVNNDYQGLSQYRYIFEIDNNRTFNSASFQQHEITPDNELSAQFLLENAEDNQIYYWRVKVTDGISESEWATSQFSVNIENDPAPENAVMRIYHPDTGWQPFVVDDHNVIYSAPGEPGICPEPGNSAYQTGIIANHHCIMMLIQDNGFNDSAQQSHYRVQFLGGISSINQPTYQIHPTKGLPDMVIEISGTGFGSVTGKVSLGTQNAKTVFWQDDKIQFTVPKLTAGQYPVIIKTQNKTLSVADFIIPEAKITQINPHEGRAGNTITLSGEFFGSKRPWVKIGKRYTRVVSFQNNEIVIKVPYFMRKGQYDISIITSHGTAIMNDAFKLTRSWW